MSSNVPTAEVERGAPAAGLFASAWIGWLPLVVLPAALATVIPATWPRWTVMWLLAGTIFYCLKWLTWQSDHRPPTTVRRQWAWWLAWPGMDPHRFLSLEPIPRSHHPRLAEWVKAISIAIFGCFMCWLARPILMRGWEIAAAWCWLFGMLFILHFGLLHIISCAWRAAGVDARPIMNEPLSSTSTVEFWGRRWNIAFRDLAHISVFLPIARRWGNRPAIVGVFLFSSVLHEAAISIPARGGYGLPTLYFLGQLCAVMLDVSPRKRRLAAGRGWGSRILTLAIVMAPAPILFHLPFLRNAVVPFLKILYLHS
jgi:Membrane bound O-acyl transferase family